MLKRDVFQEGIHCDTTPNERAALNIRRIQPVAMAIDLNMPDITVSELELVSLCPTGNSSPIIQWLWQLCQEVVKELFMGVVHCSRFMSTVLLDGLMEGFNRSGYKALEPLTEDFPPYCPMLCRSVQCWKS